jgi:succinyl-CoA synthetase beta subunit
MNIHEYQAKAVLKKYGVPVSRGKVAFTPEEAESIAKELGGSLWVVKAQIHAGGRGKAGGVKLAKTVEEVKQYTQEMLGMILKTHQTGPEGQEVKRVYIEEGSDIETELYFSAVIDRDTSFITFMASTEGGIDIEAVAEETPEKIFTTKVDPASGFQPFHARQLAFGLEIPKELQRDFFNFAKGIYDAFVDTDASQVEINPLIISKQGKLIALDAKMNFDSNALYRQAEIVELRDTDEEDPLELQASEYDLAYIKMDGKIGCMVNGAGLAMATMDIINLYGSEPANFLDVGGGATKEKVTEAFKIILSDPNVEGILVNIFGGIMRCDVIAEGVVAASREVNLSVPLVVRLEGTNVEEGKKIMAESGLPIQSGDDLADAARKIVTAVEGRVAA